jgi:hypothetical protein
MPQKLWHELIGRKKSGLDEESSNQTGLMVME